ncbi:hypothetical protein [Winogradskyella haliclonae]|uniref:Preprotein translocase subunit SecB n=1 Tax=Winogradskyella haliclonae TaxID=2048558 RepID=A0ABQ2C2N0_9FLAO|nr:hypothetical protein [Winogradskyella haliclonae]GGI58486.1 hypothetical protein GCM10011444_27950 [Winogradskyella haliclonae]
MSGKFDASLLEIRDLKIIKGEINAPFEFDTESINSYATDLSFDAFISKEKKIVKTEIGFDIQTQSSADQEEAIAKFVLVYLFHVENLDLILDFEATDDKVNINERNLMMAIAAISFSTSRGVLMTRLQGTIMKDYILPIIDPKEINRK